MIRVHRRPLRLGAAVLVLGLLAAGCGSPSSSAQGKVEESTTTTTIAKGPDSTAAQLRSRLNGLLEEYVYLGSAASGAATGRRADEFTAAAAAVRGNGDSVIANISAIYGATSKAGTDFATLWKKQVEGFLAYAQGNAASVNDLNDSTRDLGTFAANYLPSLTADAVTGLAAAAVQKLKAVVDAQSAGNQTDAYTNQRAAATQMGALAASLTTAIAKKDPDKIGGDPNSKGAELLGNLTIALRESVFLTSTATDAALGGRNDELSAAKVALDNSSAALTDVVAGIYGPAAGTTFGPLWSKHTGSFFDYAAALGAKQQANADSAMDNLLQFSQDFGDFLNTASPKISKDSAAALMKTHVSAMKDAIDAQGARNFTKAYAGERVAADYMSTIANTLAPIIVAQFQGKY
jgi:hypothetical protein